MTFDTQTRLPLPDAAFAPAAREIRAGDAVLTANDTVTMPGGTEAGRFAWNADRNSRVKIPRAE